MITKNQIIIQGTIYDLISNKIGKMNCDCCDLKTICEEKLDIKSMLCNIFNIDTNLNGYFKKVDV